jgi:hypothetical protein
MAATRRSRRETRVYTKPVYVERERPWMNGTAVNHQQSSAKADTEHDSLSMAGWGESADPPSS